ncbi:uncharacterized protein METZ01_LOCUS488553, partial [marine metagenome]
INPNLSIIGINHIVAPSRIELLLPG